MEEIRKHDIRSVAVPPLGSGLGGLVWHDVRRRIEKTLRGFNDLRIVVFEPTGARGAMVRNREAPMMTPGRAALIGLMDRYLRGLLDPFVTLLEVHKLMYFMQVAGEPLKLRYKKAPYGPYAGNLRHVLNEVEGYFISGYAAGGDTPDKPLELVPGAIEDAETFLEDHDQTRARFERVTDLVAGFESAFGLELLATVHWVLDRESAGSIDEVIVRTHKWNAGKKRFSHRQIELAADALIGKVWTKNTAPRGP